MIPFVGYNMADYFGHWLKLGWSVPKRPQIFQVNWFRTDASGRYVWPGFGENMRVLKWIVERVGGKAKAIETPLGWVPDYDDLEWSGMDAFTRDQYKSATTIKHDEWEAELALHDELLGKLKDRLPRQLALRREMLHLVLSA